MKSTLAAVGMAALVAGCGDGLVTVSGTVTLDGRPLPDAAVTFLPVPRSNTEGIGASYGRTGPDGRYILSTVQQEHPGVHSGDHKVTISLPKAAPPGNGDVDQLESLPTKYNSKTELTFVVPPNGTDQANFELRSSAK